MILSSLVLTRATAFSSRFDKDRPVLPTGREMDNGISPGLANSGDEGYLQQPREQSGASSQKGIRDAAKAQDQAEASEDALASRAAKQAALVPAATSSAEVVRTLVDECASTIDGNGFGTATIDKAIVISNQSVQIPVPCRLVFGTGGALTFMRVELRSFHLHISDDDAGRNNRLLIEDSHFVGEPGAALLVGFLGSNDQVVMRRSTVEYPMGIGISASTEGPPPSGVELTDVVLRARQEGSKMGIVAHDFHFEGLTIDTTYQETLLLGQRCTGNGVRGATARCRTRP